MCGLSAADDASQVEAGENHALVRLSRDRPGDPAPDNSSGDRKALLGGWASFISLLFIFFAFLLGLRWVRRKLMWRLRNRLIVTYMFIGVIPVILLVARWRSSRAICSPDSLLRMSQCQTCNRSCNTWMRPTIRWRISFASLARDGKLKHELAREIATASDETSATAR